MDLYILEKEALLVLPGFEHRIVANVA